MLCLLAKKIFCLILKEYKGYWPFLSLIKKALLGLLCFFAKRPILRQRPAQEPELVNRVGKLQYCCLGGPQCVWGKYVEVGPLVVALPGWPTAGPLWAADHLA